MDTDQLCLGREAIRAHPVGIRAIRLRVFLLAVDFGSGLDPGEIQRAIPGQETQDVGF
jgi:hypothetical protein